MDDLRWKEGIMDVPIVDKRTGEVIDTVQQEVVYKTLKQHLVTQEYFERQKHNAFIREEYQQYGEFIWNVYTLSENTFPGLKPSDITRLMFVATYVGYDGFLKKNKSANLTKEALTKTLKLSDREWYRFWGEMTKRDILKERDNGIALNKQLFLKGSVPAKRLAKFAERNQYITRLYVSAIRDLYNKATPNSHKTLSYLFQVIPFVNRQYNIVCHNPLEPDLKKIKPMTLGEFCDIIDYDKNHAARLCNTLFASTFMVDGEPKSAISCVANKSLHKHDFKMFINPMVYYAGTQWDKVKVLGKF